MAFGNSNDIDIKVNVDASKGITTLKQTEQAVEGVGRAASVAAGFIAPLGAALGSVATLATIQALAKSGVELIKLGAQVDDISGSFEDLSKKAGGSAEVLLGDLRQATQGTIRDLDLMRQANRLLVAGFPTKYFDDLARAASKYADAQGREVNEVLDEFISGVIRGNPRVVQLIEDTERLAEVTPDAADAIDRIGASFSNAFDGLARQVATNQELNKALQELAKTIASIDFTPLLNGISTFITYSIQAVKITDDLVANFFLLDNAVADSLAKSLIGEEKQLKETTDLLKFLNADSQKLSRTQAEAAKNTEKLTDGIKAYNKVRRDERNETEKIKKVVKEDANEHVRLYEQFKKLNSIQGVRGAISQFAEIRKALEDGIIDVHRYSQEVATLVEQLKAANMAQDNLGTAVRLGLGGSNVSSPQSGGGVGAGALEGLFGVNFDSIEQSLAGLSDSEAWGEAGRQIAIQMAQALSSTLQTLLSGGQVSGSQIGGLAGGGIGAIIGASLGGPAGLIGGAQLGSAIGDLLGGAIEGLLGSDSAGTKARKALDKWFADLFDADRLQVIINGELSEIEDLVFQGLTNFGGQVSMGDNSVFNYLQSLPQSVQAAFQGVGQAIAELTGQGEEMAEYLGAVLANNIGGSLNNLQLLLQSTGASTEQLRESLIKAFTDGRMSAIELQNALMQVEQLAQVGIPGALGDVEQAFNNLQAAGFRGGDALFDALRDIGAEANELGIHELPQLANVLINQFGFAANQVENFMAAMAATGLQSIQALVNASMEELAALAANLQAITEGKPADFKPVAPTTPPSAGGGGSRGGGRSGPTQAQQEAERFRASVLQLVMANQDYEAVLQSLNAGLLTQGQAQKLVNNLFDEATRLLKLQNKLEKEAAEQMAKRGKVAVDTANKLEKVQEKIKKFAEQTKEAVGNPKVFQGFLDFIKKISDPNLINIALNSSGLADDAKAQIMKDFQAGKISAAEAQKRLGQIGPGIADQFGRADLAVGNLMRAGTSGGAVSIDAFKDIFAEAKEQGAQSIEDVQKLLTAQGVDPAIINAIVVAAQNKGITSVDQALSAGDDIVIGIISQLEQLSFPFEQTSSEIKTIAEEIAAIPDSKEVNVTVNFDANLPDWLRDLLFGPNSPYGKGEDSKGQGTNDSKNGGGKKPGGKRGGKHRNKPRRR